MTLASEQATIASLSERFYQRVYAFARQLTDASTAEDVTQEVFLKLLRMDDLDQREIKSSYLIKMAHNLIRGQRRKASVAIEPQGIERRADKPAKPERRASALDLQLNELTTNEEVAIRLTVCRGLSLREASEALGVKVTTVTNWKYRGLKKLAERRAEQVAAA
jgi:RNA polymerase sigma factor (sigma-70 family)